MEILKETVPKAAVIAVLWNANDHGMTLRYRQIEEAARILKVEVQALGVREPDDFAVAFSSMTRRPPDAMFLVADALTNLNRQRIIEFAAMQRIPAMYEFGFIVRDGGLISYGPNDAEGLRQAAAYVDRILKGAKPADLPALQPTRYYLFLTSDSSRWPGDSRFLSCSIRGPLHRHPDCATDTLASRPVFLRPARASIAYDRSALPSAPGCRSDSRSLYSRSISPCLTRPFAGAPFERRRAMDDNYHPTAEKCRYLPSRATSRERRRL
jgi:hypothetical protein